MKEKIKKLMPNDCTAIFAVAYTVFAVYTFFVGDWVIGILCLAIALCNFALFLKGKKCKELLARNEHLYQLAKECNDNEKSAIETTQWAYDELQLEMQRHRLTAIKLMIQKNKADFMQRKKSLTQYLKYADAADGLYEQEVKRLHEMMDEIKRNNNDGKEQQSKDTETETTGA